MRMRFEAVRNTEIQRERERERERGIKRHGNKGETNRKVNGRLPKLQSG